MIERGSRTPGRWPLVVALAACLVPSACRRAPSPARPVPAATPASAATERAAAPTARPSSTVAAASTVRATAATASTTRRPPPAATSGDVGGLAQGTALPTALPGPARVEGGTIGGRYDLVDVRVGRHEGFTRVVWQMAQPDGAPRYVARLEEAPDGWRLAVVLSDVSAFDSPRSLEPEAGPAGGAVTAVSIMPMRDDALLAFAVDLREPARFQVTTLQDPVRVVVDVFDAAP